MNRGVSLERAPRWQDCDESRLMGGQASDQAKRRWPGWHLLESGRRIL